MKAFIIIGLVAVILFGASFAGSYLLRRQSAALLGRVMGGEAAGAKTADNGNHPQPAPAAHQADGATNAVRPAFMPGTDEVVQLSSSLRDRLAAVRDKEKKLSEREKKLELVAKDISGERAAIDELRKQVSDELKALDEQTGVIEKKHLEVQQRHQEASQKIGDAHKRLLEMDGIERKNFEKMASMYDSMSPESAARILQQLSDMGKLDTAVKLLAQMKERNAAKVLADLPDATLAAQLLDRLKEVKRHTSTPATGAAGKTPPAPSVAPPSIAPAGPEKPSTPPAPMPSDKNPSPPAPKGA